MIVSKKEVVVLEEVLPNSFSSLLRCYMTLRYEGIYSLVQYSVKLNRISKRIGNAELIFGWEMEMGVPATIPLDFSAVYASIFTFYILLCMCVFVFHVFSFAPSQYPQIAQELRQQNRKTKKNMDLSE